MNSADTNGDSALPPSLAAMHDKLLANLASATSQTGDTFPILDDERKLPFQLGRFHLLERLGRGGQGTVFRANDPAKATTVAIKLLNTSGPMWDNSRRTRFRREAQLAARIDHANVAPVLEAGQLEGVAYLVMPFCPGPTLAQWMQSHAGQFLHPTEVARFVRELAYAAGACHARGVLHRDLKPANVLLFPNADTPSFDAPLSAFQPRISDFGLSRAEDDGESLTETGVILGTRAYMSPEQAAGKWDDIGVAADVWSLGVILYELLTRKKPFGDDWQTIVKLQYDTAMDPPRQLNPLVPHDLEAITLKCLSKSIEMRYSTAQALGEDLTRFINQEPTTARPLKPLGRSYRWFRRRPLVAASMAGFLLLVVLLTIGIFLHLFSLEEHNLKLKEALTTSQRLELEARRRNYDFEIRRCGDLLHKGDESALFAHLEGLRPNPGQYDSRDFSWRHISWRLGGSRFTKQLFRSTSAITYTHDGKKFATVSELGKVHLWDAKTTALLTQLSLPASIDVHGFFLPRILICPNQRWLVVNYLVVHQDTNLKYIEHACWDLHQPDVPPRILKTKSFSDAFKGIHFSKTGDTLFLIKQEQHRGSYSFALNLTTIDMNTWSEIRSQALPGNLVRDLRPDSDGRTWWTMTVLAERVSQGTLMQYYVAHINPESSEAPVVQMIHTEYGNPNDDAAFDPVHQRYALLHKEHNAKVVAMYDHNLKHLLWKQTWTIDNLDNGNRLMIDETGREIGVWRGEGRDEKRIITAGVWQAETGQPVLEYTKSAFTTSSNEVLQVIRHPTLPEYAIARDDGTVHIRPAIVPTTPFIKLSQPGPIKEIWSLIFQNNNHFIAGGDLGYCKSWDVQTRKLQSDMGHGNHLVFAMTLLPDCKDEMLTADYEGQVRLWNSSTGKLLHFWQATYPKLKLCAVAVSNDGRWVAAGGKSDQLWIWDRQKNKITYRPTGHPDRVRAIVFMGTQLISAGEGGILRSCDVTTGITAWEKRVADELWCMSSVTIDDRLVLITGNRRGDLIWYDANNGVVIRSASVVHPGGIHALAISPDKKTIATAGDDQLVKLWDLITGEELLTLTGHTKALRAIAFSPDGRTLVSGGLDGQILIWPTAGE